MGGFLFFIFYFNLKCSVAKALESCFTVTPGKDTRVQGPFISHYLHNNNKTENVNFHSV